MESAIQSMDDVMLKSVNETLNTKGQPWLTSSKCLYCSAMGLYSVAWQPNFFRQITSHEKEWYRPVVRDGNRVHDSFNRLNWGALAMHGVHPLQLPLSIATGKVTRC